MKTQNQQNQISDVQLNSRIQALMTEYGLLVRYADVDVLEFENPNFDGENTASQRCNEYGLLALSYCIPNENGNGSRLIVHVCI